MAAVTGRKRLFLFGVSIVFALVVGLILGELILAVYPRGQLQGHTKRVMQNEFDPHIVRYLYSTNPSGEFRRMPADLPEPGWRLFDTSMPSSELSLDRMRETPWYVDVRFSKQGLRDREYGVKPPPGVTRIVGVGDSFTVGEGVPLDRSLMKQVEGLLGDGYEVVNAAYPGASIRNESLILPRVVARLNSQRAIVVFVLNDIDLTPELKRKQDDINDLVTPGGSGWRPPGRGIRLWRTTEVRDDQGTRGEATAWYSGRSRLLYLLGSTLTARRIKRETIQWYRDTYDERYNGENLQKMRGDLLKIASTPNSRVVFVMYPLVEELEGEYLFRDIHRRVGEMARDAGMPVLDLAPFFEKRRTSSLQVHPADHHPNGDAHSLAATAIVAWLRRDVTGFLDRETASDETTGRGD